MIDINTSQHQNTADISIGEPALLPPPFDITKYQTIVNDVHKNLFNYLNDIDKKKLSHAEKDLAIINECFAQLKFNYIETGSKQQFIQSIVVLDSQLTSPSQQAVTQLESAIAKGKKEFKELKYATSKLMTEVVAFINLIADQDAKLQKERDNLQRLLADASDQLAKMFEIEQAIQELERQNNEVISTNDMLASSIEWYQPYIRMVEKLQGVRLKSVGGHEVVLDLSVANVAHAVTLRLDPARKTVASIHINPSPVALDHLAQDLAEAHEMASLIEEMTFALTNHYKREREIKDASQSYQIRRVNGSPLSIEVSLSTGHVCTIKFDSDYPLHPNGHIRLMAIHRQGQAIDSIQFDSIQTQVQRPDRKYDLVQLVHDLIVQLQSS